VTLQSPQAGWLMITGPELCIKRHASSEQTQKLLLNQWLEMI
jgi:hypothetical protein